MKKYLCFILALMLLISMLSGCLAKENPADVKVTADGILTYSMNQDVIDRFYDLLTQTEELAIAGEDLEKTETVTDELEAAYMDLFDQYQTAYVIYCLDQADENAKKQYLYCVEVVSEAETAYNEACKRIWLSETPLREKLFEDWSQEEIDRMLLHNEEIAQLEKRNEELTVAYRELSGSDNERDAAMIPLYNEMVKNNNRIAEIYGYDNYYEYACDVVYQRDYEQTETEKLYQYAARYLPDIYEKASQVYAQEYNELSKQEKKLFSQFTNQAYDTLKENYVSHYMEDMPDSAREKMQSMFADQRVVFTSYKYAYKGAYTTFIDDKPFCYYGPGYSDSETVIHEMGHYYGSNYVKAWSQPVDLAETQSQGNEWLFVQFMKSQMSSQIYESIVAQKLSSDIGYIICFVMVDRFEQMVYTHERAGELTLEEYDAIMAEIAEDFGGIDYVRQEILNVQRYWKRVVLETPVYYISYAVSGLAAINLFTVAETDEAKARQMYIKLIEEPVEDAGFLGNIQNAGLAGPFEETVYEQLQQRYAK